MTANNPLLQDFDLPPYSQIKPEHVEPAVDQILADSRAAIAKLLEQQQAFMQSMVGKTIDLLLEKPGRMPGQIIGRSPWLQSVNVDAKTSQIGDIIQVRITDVGPNSLFAEVAEG